MEAYLDNAATTKVSEGVKAEVVRMMTEDYGNPSSLHRKGMEAEKPVKTAREIIAASMKVEPKEIIFTSGGTESNNMALIGAALAARRTGKHLISTQFEHASVSEPLLFLERMGYEIDFVPVDSLGHIDLEKLKSMIREDTILVSVMYVNNEVGAVQDIATIADIVHSAGKNILFHVDAIQAYGKYKIFPKKLGIDMLSVSGHKIHGPKGSGFLYAKDRIKLLPIIYGGGQQKGMRSGTENVPAIVGLGKAVEEIYTNHEEKQAHLYQLKQHMIDGLNEIEGVTVNAIPENLRDCAPHIVSASFQGVRSEVLLHALEEKSIYVSSGSACASNHPGISGSLTAIGVDKDLLESTIRFSFSVNTQEEELDYALAALKELLPTLRKYTRR